MGSNDSDKHVERANGKLIDATLQARDEAMLASLVMDLTSEDWKKQVASLESLQSMCSAPSHGFLNTDGLRDLIRQVVECALSLRSSVSTIGMKTLACLFLVLDDSPQGVNAIDIVVPLILPKTICEKRFVAASALECLEPLCQSSRPAIQVRTILCLSKIVDCKHATLASKASELIATIVETMVGSKTLTPSFFTATLLPLVSKMLVGKLPPSKVSGRKILASVKRYFSTSSSHRCETSDYYSSGLHSQTHSNASSPPPPSSSRHRHISRILSPRSGESDTKDDGGMFFGSLVHKYLVEARVLPHAEHMALEKAARCLKDYYKSSDGKVPLDSASTASWVSSIRSNKEIVPSSPPSRFLSPSSSPSRRPGLACLTLRHPGTGRRLALHRPPLTPNTSHPASPLRSASLTRLPKLLTHQLPASTSTSSVAEMLIEQQRKTSREDDAASRSHDSGTRPIDTGCSTHQHPRPTPQTTSSNRLEQPLSSSSKCDHSKSTENSNRMNSGRAETSNGMNSGRAENCNGMNSEKAENCNGMNSGRAENSNKMNSGKAENCNGMNSGRADDNNRMNSGKAENCNGMNSGRAEDSNRMSSGRAEDNNRISLDRAEDNNRMNLRKVEENNRMNSGRAEDNTRIGSDRAEDRNMMNLERAQDNNRMNSGKEEDNNGMKKDSGLHPNSMTHHLPSSSPMPLVKDRLATSRTFYDPSYNQKNHRVVRSRTGPCHGGAISYQGHTDRYRQRQYQEVTPSEHHPLAPSSSASADLSKRPPLSAKSHPRDLRKQSGQMMDTKSSSSTSQSKPYYRFHSDPMSRSRGRSPHLLLPISTLSSNTPVPSFSQHLRSTTLLTPTASTKALHQQVPSPISRTAPGAIRRDICPPKQLEPQQHPMLRSHHTATTHSQTLNTPHGHSILRTRTTPSSYHVTPPLPSKQRRPGAPLHSVQAKVDSGLQDCRFKDTQQQQQQQRTDNKRLDTCHNTPGVVQLLDEMTTFKSDIQRFHRWQPPPSPQQQQQDCGAMGHHLTSDNWTTHHQTRSYHGMANTKTRGDHTTSALPILLTSNGATSTAGPMGRSTNRHGTTGLSCTGRGRTASRHQQQTRTGPLLPPSDKEQQQQEQYTTTTTASTTAA